MPPSVSTRPPWSRLAPWCAGRNEPSVPPAKGCAAVAIGRVTDRGKRQRNARRAKVVMPARTSKAALAAHECSVLQSTGASTCFSRGVRHWQLTVATRGCHISGGRSVETFVRSRAAAGDNLLLLLPRKSFAIRHRARLQGKQRLTVLRECEEPTAAVPPVRRTSRH